MTAINITTDIPSTITTLEQLVVWGGNCLFNLNSNVTAVEGDNYSQRACQAGTYYISSTDKTRHVGRQSIELSADHAVGGLKPWAYALPISDKPLTATMKAN